MKSSSAQAECSPFTEKQQQSFFYEKAATKSSRIGMTILPAGTRPDGWGYGYKILPAGTGMGMEFYTRVEYG